MLFRNIFCISLILFFFFSCNRAQSRLFLSLEGEQLERVDKSDEEWRKDLTEMEYEVLREAGTERAFTGDLWDHKEKGIYTCAACGLPLYSSATKFVSGTGWPSFYKPIRKDHVAEEEDRQLGMVRTEVLCARCGSHLGHVFDDGPPPTGLRHCINSVSLDFVRTENLKLKAQK